MPNTVSHGGAPFPFMLQLLCLCAPPLGLDGPSASPVCADMCAAPCLFHVALVASQILNISAPLVVLDSPPAATEGQEADLSAIQLCLLDTPGPNEAGEEGLKYQVGSGLIFDAMFEHLRRNFERDSSSDHSWTHKWMRNCNKHSATGHNTCNSILPRERALFAAAQHNVVWPCRRGSLGVLCVVAAAAAICVCAGRVSAGSF